MSARRNDSVRNCTYTFVLEDSVPQLTVSCQFIVQVILLKEVSKDFCGGMD